MVRIATKFVFAASILASAALWAQEPGEITDDEVHPLLINGFSIDVGVFVPRRTLDLRVDRLGDALAGENTLIDFDQEFGLKNADETTALELAWRFGERWSFLGQYFKSTYGRTKTLDEDIEWDDIVFNAGSSATLAGGFQLTRFYFGRELDTQPEHNFGIGGGIHWLDIGTAIEGTVIVNGQPFSERRSARVEGPLPNIGVWYKYSITPRWAFRSRLDLSSASIDRYDGYMINGGVGLNFRAWEHIGFGLSYNYFELDVDIEKSDWRGNIETIYKGGFVSVTAYF